jgi:hypothetical protein
MIYHIRHVFDLLDVNQCGLVQTSEILEALLQHPETDPDLVTYIEESLFALMPTHKASQLPYAERLKDIQKGQGRRSVSSSMEPDEEEDEVPTLASHPARGKRPSTTARAKRPSTTASTAAGHTHSLQPNPSLNKRASLASTGGSMRASFIKSGGDGPQVPGKRPAISRRNSRRTSTLSLPKTPASQLPFINAGPVASFFGTNHHVPATEEEMLEGKSDEEQENILDRLTGQLERWEGTRREKEKKLAMLADDKENRRMMVLIERKMGVNLHLENAHDHDGHVTLNKKQLEKISLHKVLHLLFGRTKSPKEMDMVWYEIYLLPLHAHIYTYITSLYTRAHMHPFSVQLHVHTYIYTHASRYESTNTITHAHLHTHAQMRV